MSKWVGPWAWTNRPLGGTPEDSSSEVLGQWPNRPSRDLREFDFGRDRELERLGKLAIDDNGAQEEPLRLPRQHIFDVGRERDLVEGLARGPAGPEA